eukprot:jgi/Bigna1/80019/fgenesh1_pg.67_\
MMRIIENWGAFDDALWTIKGRIDRRKGNSQLLDPTSLCAEKNNKKENIQRIIYGTDGRHRVVSVRFHDGKVEDVADGVGTDAKFLSPGGICSHRVTRYIMNLLGTGIYSCLIPEVTTVASVRATTSQTAAAAGGIEEEWGEEGNSNPYGLNFPRGILSFDIPHINDSIVFLADREQSHPPVNYEKLSVMIYLNQATSGSHTIRALHLHEDGKGEMVIVGGSYGEAGFVDGSGNTATFKYCQITSSFSIKEMEISPTDIAGQGSYIYKRKKLRGKEEDSSGIDINGGFILNISLSILIADTGNSRIRQLYFETEVEAQEEPTVANTTTPTNNAPYSCKICKCLLQQGARQTLVNVSTIQLETTKYTERDIYRISGYAEDLDQFFIADQGQASIRALKRYHPDDLQSLQFSVHHLEGCSNMDDDNDNDDGESGVGSRPKISFIPRPQIDCPSYRFPSPTCLCAEAAGHWLFVGDSEYECIKKVTKDGVSVWDLTRPLSVREAREIVDGMCC